MYYPDVPALDPEDIELLCNEYIAHNKHLDPHIACLLYTSWTGTSFPNFAGTARLNLQTVQIYYSRPDKRLQGGSIILPA